MTCWRKVTKQCALFILIALVCCQGSADTKELFDTENVQTSDEPVRILADSVTYDRNQGLYEAQGDVEIYWAEQTLEADYVEFYEVAYVARATGNVTYTKGEDRLDCQYLEINLENKQGQIREGKLFYKEGNVHLSGTNLQKVGEDHYILENGDITTCDGERPPWKISYKEADVTVEGWAEVRHATFNIKNIPVLYTPYVRFPAKVKRQTGFLMPSFGYSSSEGAVLNNEFFWAISENTDATFYIDAATNKGPGFGTEYRYVTSDTNYGRLYGYYTYESSRYQEDEFKYPPGNLDRSQNRWNLVYEGKEDFTDDLFFRAWVNLVSDKQYYADYGYTSVEQTAESIESTAFITRLWNQQGFSLVGDFEYNKDLEENFQKEDYQGIPSQDKPDPVNRYPQILLTGLPRLLGTTPLYLALDSSYTNFYRNRGVEGSRVTMNPHLTWPVRLWDNYRFETEGGVLQTLYFDTHNKELGQDFDNNRTLFHFRTALSTKFMKVFQSVGNAERKYRHTIEPELSYNYIPDKDDQQEDYPQYDGGDEIEEENRIMVALTNRLMSKLFRANDDSTASESEVLYAKIGQAYDASTSDDPFSNSFLEVRTRPVPFLYLKSALEYDWYNEEFDKFNTLAMIDDYRGDAVSAEYRYTNQDPEETDGTANVESLTTRAELVLTDWLSAFFRNRHDLRASRNLQTVVGLDYQAQCWGAILSYRKRASTDGRESDKTIMIEFVLRGIGKVGGFESGG